jgi:hypothetical protein
MNYNEFKKKLKTIRLSGKDLTAILEIDKTTPSAYWKKRDEVPIYISILLELLEKLPEDDRILFIHHKLKL